MRVTTILLMIMMITAALVATVTTTVLMAADAPPKAFTVEWGVLLPVLFANCAPILTGLLQQMSKKFSESAPWYAKWAVTTLFSTLIAAVGTYAANGDALLGSAAGAVVGTFGSLSIALRKGVGRFFTVEVQPPPAPLAKNG